MDKLWHSNEMLHTHMQVHRHTHTHLPTQPPTHSHKHIYQSVFFLKKKYITERSQYKNDCMLQSHLYDSGKCKTMERVGKSKPTNKTTKISGCQGFQGRDGQINRMSGASQCSVHYYSGTQVVTHHMTAHRGHTTQWKPGVNKRLWVMSSNGSLPSVANVPCWYRTLRMEEALTGWGQEAHGDSVPYAQLSHEPGNCSKNVHS